jgi:DNA-binding LytR/AlgR family response regulator
MIHIAICDDESIICSEIAETIENHHDDFLENFHISVYTSGELLYEDLMKGHHFDLIFLDIELYKINGIDIGVLIRKSLDNQLTQIVYISSKQKYAMDLFTIHPLDFLIKPINPDKVILAIKLMLKMRRRETEYFSYQMKGITKKVALTDIYYFESNARKIKLVSTAGEDEFYGKLKEIYERIKSFSFIYIHKSYIVNYLWLNTINPHEMILENGKTLPVSRSMQKQVIKRISEIRMDGNN